MSTINQVRSAEAKMKSVLDALKTAKEEDPNYLDTELKCAHEETRIDRRGLAWTTGRNGSCQSSLRQML